MSANLTLIKQVCLYAGLSETGADQFFAYQTLANANVPFTFLNYGDHFDGANATFAALNTWLWGANSTLSFNTFPIVTWQECYDDFTILNQCAVGSANVANSNLLANKSLVANT